MAEQTDHLKLQVTAAGEAEEQEVAMQGVANKAQVRLELGRSMVETTAMLWWRGLIELGL